MVRSKPGAKVKHSTLQRPIMHTLELSINEMAIQIDWEAFDSLGKIDVTVAITDDSGSARAFVPAVDFAQICREFFKANFTTLMGEDGQFFHMSVWECESKANLLGFCIYNIEDDPAKDSCLFCHEPLERK